MEIESKDLKVLLESIRHVYGYDFTDYAEASVKRRILHFMNQKQIILWDEFGGQILRDEKLFEEFVQVISVTVTEMFRDPTFYKSLRTHVMERLATYPFVKIWVAGCATGEEVYSIAILLKEHNLLNRSVIYATDINQKSLQIAKEGVYTVENMKSHIENYRKAGGFESFSEYYKVKYDSVMFDKSLKQNIVFSPHNLAVDRSFNEFQFIICRNVLIYFNQQLQNKVISLFHESLCPFGFLGLGSKESLMFSEKKKMFEEVDRKEKIFIKTR
jgi:chemotaxis protein methyltransferase CheR